MPRGAAPATHSHDLGAPPPRRSGRARVEKARVVGFRSGLNIEPHVKGGAAPKVKLTPEVSMKS